MKLELTYNETSNLIRRHFNLNSDVEIVITDVPNVVKVDPAVPALIKDINGMAWWGNEKIRAIKRFRETVACGLAEAKWAVESWDSVYDWMKKNGRLPKFDGSYSNGTIRLV
jgi:ribosomal protein L7/L12